MSTRARPGELIALCNEELDLTGGVLLICGAWKSRGEFRHLGEPKTTTRMVEIRYRHRLTDIIDVTVQPMEQVLRPEDPGGPETR